MALNSKVSMAILHRCLVIHNALEKRVLPASCFCIVVLQKCDVQHCPLLEFHMPYMATGQLLGGGIMGVGIFAAVEGLVDTIPT
jgi:hypothetical protein